MEKELLKQRYNFAEITPYKDHTKLEEKPTDLMRSTTSFSDEDNVFCELSGSTGRKKGKGLSFNLDSHSDRRRKNTKFFYSGESVGENIRLISFFNGSQTFITDKQKHILRHFGRAFSNISLQTYERSIFIKNDKITIKLTTFSKSRYLNCRYFKKSSHTYGVTIDIKNGNFVTYEGSKNARKVRKNLFTHLNHIIGHTSLTSINEVIKSRFNDADYVESKRILTNLNSEFDDKVFYETLYHYFNTIEGYSTYYPNYDSKVDCQKWFFINIVSLFIKLNKIKVPNDYYRLITSCYPTKKYLKKNNNKLIAAILDRCGLKSKQTIKLLHEQPNLDITILHKLKTYFGNDLNKMLPLLDVRFFKSCSELKQSDQYQFISFFSFLEKKNFSFDLDKTEKNNLIKLLNQFTIENLENHVNKNRSGIVEQQLNQVDDHLNMIRKLTEYYPETKLRAKNWSEFHNEHLELSRMDRTIKRGYIVEYVFEDYVEKYIQEPIKIYKQTEMGTDLSEFTTFYPVLLKQDIEYSEEGTHMHHCVASYANKEISIIVSLRLGDPYGTDRVTNEFDVRNKECLQSRYFCNAAPPDYFVEAVERLKQRIESANFSIKSKEKKQTPLVINGKQVLDTGQNIFDMLGF